MSKNSGVIVRDLGMNAWIRRWKKLHQTAWVQVGIQGPEALQQHGESAGKTNVEIAVAHEFGVPKTNLPQRSFIRTPVSDNADKYQRMIKKQTDAYLAGKISLEVGLGRIGLQAVTDIRNAIKKRIPPPLKQRTIDRKSENNETPLIDTRQMMRAVTYAVVIGNKKVQTGK